MILLYILQVKLILWQIKGLFKIEIDLDKLIKLLIISKNNFNFI